MPPFHRLELHASDGLRLGRVSCDGADPARPADEVFDGDRIIVALSGCFAVRGRDGRAVVDPTAALVIRAGAEVVFSHPRGRGDVCVAVTGRVATWLADGISDRGVEARSTTATGYAEVRDLDRGLPADQGVEPAAIEEALCAALSPPTRVPDNVARRERAIAERIAHELGCRFDERLRLDQLAGRVGVSPFHACRVFRRVTGTSIHRHRMELRLRHALAGILDGEPLAHVALATGFASQAHLTTCFGRRFGVTPARARALGPAALRERGARPGT